MLSHPLCLIIRETMSLDYASGGLQRCAEVDTATAVHISHKNAGAFLIQYMNPCSYCCKSHLQHYRIVEIPVSLANDFSRSSYGRIHNSPLVAEPPQGVSPIRCECHYMLTADSGFSNCQGSRAISALLIRRG